MRTGAPVVRFRDAKPALLLEKVQEHNLAHQLLGEVHAVDALGRELVAEVFVFCNEFFQRSVDLLE